MKEQRVLLCSLLQTSLFPLLVEAGYFKEVGTFAKVQPLSWVCIRRSEAFLHCSRLAISYSRMQETDLCL
jgi:hypothetical protein